MRIYNLLFTTERKEKLSVINIRLLRLTTLNLMKILLSRLKNLFHLFNNGLLSVKLTKEAVKDSLKNFKKKWKNCLMLMIMVMRLKSVMR